MNEAVDEFGKLGARVIAVTPDRPQIFNPEEERPDVGFPILWDEDAKVIQQYGLAYELSPELTGMFKGGGLDLKLRNDSNKVLLPVPAVYVIDTEGKVRYAFMDYDYTRRAEPNDVLVEVRAIAQ